MNIAEERFFKLILERLDALEKKVDDLSKKDNVLGPQPGGSPYRPDNPYPVSKQQGCSLCGIGANEGILGYVCPNSNCPSAIAYGTPPWPGW